jgi:hypothetical protein
MFHTPFDGERSCRFIPLFFCLFVLGCEQDEIRRYKVAKERPPEAKARLLGVILPQKDKTWFFKLSGPIQSVSEQEKNFDQFMRSVRPTQKADEELTWTLPEGWRRDPQPRPQRYATIVIGAGEKPLELAVNSFPGDVGGLLANVNRWRGQIGLKPISDAELKQDTKEIKVDNAAGTRVDIAGPGGKPGRGPMMK